MHATLTSLAISIKYFSEFLEVLFYCVTISEFWISTVDLDGNIEKEIPGY